MKFLFISTMHEAAWGGSEGLWTQAAHQLRLEGHDVQASVGYRLQAAPQLAALAECGVTITTHASPGAGLMGRIRKRVLDSDRQRYAVLARIRPDVAVISQGGNSGGFGWARACNQAGVPYGIVVHCNSQRWWIGDGDLEHAAAAYRDATRVFCVARANLDLLRLQIGDPLSNAELVWNPINLAPGPPPPWPDEGGGWKMACVARLELAAKGQDLLLRVLTRPEWRERPIELSIYGAGPNEAILRRMAATLELKNVRFRGHVSDVASIWREHHILALPSRFEGRPLALIEAMACGRPAIVTEVGGNAELCRDGETGFVASAATCQHLGEAMERAWRQRTAWRELGAAARYTVDRDLPSNPVEHFCGRLKSLASDARFEKTVSR